MRELAIQVLEAARARGIQIATAESCTAGMIAAALTDVAGSSDVFERGFVTYSNASKCEMVGVKVETLEAFGAVSPEVAQEMVVGAVHASAAQLAVSVTGVAGPGASAHKPEGRVCFGVAMGDDAIVQTVEFGPLGRDKVRTATCVHALRLLLDALSALPEGA